MCIDGCPTAVLRTGTTQRLRRIQPSRTSPINSCQDPYLCRSGVRTFLNRRAQVVATLDVGGCGGAMTETAQPEPGASDVPNLVSEDSPSPEATDAVDGKGQAASFIDDIAGTGDEVPDADVNVTIGPHFLELFSEQLYTSPNKTFEELVSNSWDAGATDVRIGIPADLASTDAAIWVLDNGESMDVQGFKRLWSVATSEKQDRTDPPRPQIGKFGIGKLATYLLAHQLTYVCRAADGEIRVVAMDYRWIGGDKNSLHIDPVPLPVRVIQQADLSTLLEDIADSEQVIAAIDALGTASGETSVEFGGVETDPPAPSGTWTLALLTDLKPEGRSIKPGIVSRMLRTSLPLGSKFAIHFNDSPLESSKINAPVTETWIAGPDFPIKQFSVPSKDPDVPAEVVQVQAESSPHPHLLVPGLGSITGQVTLFQDSIAGGKSTALGSSNGFFVNILGRVVNAEDPYFGLENLNHAAWARFRATLRIDELNDAVSVNREGLLEGEKLDLVRAFLMACFNHVRTAYDAANRANWPDAGDILTDAWGTVPLAPLRSVIEQGLASGEMPSFVTALDGDPTDAQRESWSSVKEHSDVVSDVRFVARGAEDVVVEYDVETREIVVNESHPFVREYASSHELRLLLRDQAMADLLTSAYMTQLGVDESLLDQVELYRDQLLRLLARLRRRTGFQIAELLEQAASHKKDKALEVILGDALEALGYVVERMGGSGKPEGLATAPISPKKTSQSSAYSFTYDAKSSASKKVKTGNVGTGGLARHRDDYGANYILVVGPDFEDGALQQECEQQEITPMKATDLGRLLVATTQHGPLSLEDLEPMFALRDPAAVTSYVHDFLATLSEKAVLSYDQILDSLESIGFDSPDMLTCSVIAKNIRDSTGSPEFPTKLDVSNVLKGMQILTPQLIRVQNDNVFLGARPDTFRSALLAQVARLPKVFGSEKEK